MSSTVSTLDSSPQVREAAEAVLLALADDELIIGHRHSEWTGWAPHIEEDIAFSSIAQDEIGHAALFYRMLAELDGRSADEIAFGRRPDEYVHAQICERPNEDWGYTLARHFLYDTAERIRLESLRQSSYRPLAEVSEKLLREERYHQLHADAWFRRLSSGPVEGRHQLGLALSRALPDAVGLFESVAMEDLAVERGLLPRPNQELLQVFLDEVMTRVEHAGLPLTLTAEDEGQFIPTSAGEMIESEHDESRGQWSIRKADGRWEVSGRLPGLGGRRGIHTGMFGPLWDDLTRTYREEPAATW